MELQFESSACEYPVVERTALFSNMYFGVFAKNHVFNYITLIKKKKTDIVKTQVVSILW